MKVLVRGPALTRTGYGEHCRFVLRCLRECENLDIYLLPVNWGESTWIWENTEERSWLDEIIKKTLSELGLEKDEVSETVEEAKIIEESSNQILDFTREVKNLHDQDKIKIIESLWSIIYSNKEADVYETNLMRRLAGLLYIDNKTMGDIKERVRNHNLK